MVIDTHTRQLIFARVQLFVDFIAKKHGRVDIRKQKKKKKKITEKLNCAAYWRERHRSRSKHLSTFVISHIFANFVGGGGGGRQ